MYANIMIPVLKTFTNGATWVYTAQIGYPETTSHFTILTMAQDEFRLLEHRIAFRPEICMCKNLSCAGS